MRLKGQPSHTTRNRPLQQRQNYRRPVGRTDAQGNITAPLEAKGLYRLHVLKMERRSEPDIDWESYWATLTFELP